MAMIVSFREKLGISYEVGSSLTPLNLVISSAVEIPFKRSLKPPRQPKNNNRQQKKSVKPALENPLHPRANQVQHKIRK